MIATELKHHKLTYAQMIALDKVYRRIPLYRKMQNGQYDDFRGPTSNQQHQLQEPLTFEEFVTLFVQAGTDCIMVHWLGQWLGIEEDGYTHS